MSFDALTNRGEYLSAHYFAEQLSTELKKGLFANWAQRESDEHESPRIAVRSFHALKLRRDSNPSSDGLPPNRSSLATVLLCVQVGRAAATAVERKRVRAIVSMFRQETRLQRTLGGWCRCSPGARFVGSVSTYIVVLGPPF